MLLLLLPPLKEPIVKEVASGVPLLSTSVPPVGTELEISSLVANGVDFVTGSLPENLGEIWNLGLTPADPGRDDHLPTDPSLGAKLILMPSPILLLHLTPAPPQRSPLVLALAASSS